jgi:hypothetical protein
MVKSIKKALAKQKTFFKKCVEKKRSKNTTEKRQKWPKRFWEKIIKEVAELHHMIRLQLRFRTKILEFSMRLRLHNIRDFKKQ